MRWHCASLRLFPRLDDPRQEGAVLDERLPQAEVPALVLERPQVEARLAAQQHDDARGRARRDEAQEEHVAAAAVVALKHGVAERPFSVQRHLLELAAHQVLRGGEVQRPRVATLAPCYNG